MPYDEVVFDLRAVAEDQAGRAYDILKTPVLVEDVSLAFSAPNVLPGPRIKWFFESFGNEGLCRLLDSFVGRSARAEVEFAICDEYGVHTFSGSIEGIITEHSHERNGFGRGQMFISKGRTD
jgi:non-canonical purine NTP pyrophosphatase (RdgB/HAM1 family)